jgi:hypothetical protein
METNIAIFIITYYAEWRDCHKTRSEKATATDNTTNHAAAHAALIAPIASATGLFARYARGICTNYYYYYYYYYAASEMQQVKLKRKRRGNTVGSVCESHG